MPKQVSIEDLLFIKAENVQIKNQEAVLEKINKILCDGPNKLQVVSDFDRTITRQHINGDHGPSSFAIFLECKNLCPLYKKKSSELREKYLKMEIDPKISLEEKINVMVEWMIQEEEILQGFEFDRKEIDEVASQYSHCFRSKAKELFVKLQSFNIPILVFSAGLGDIVKAMLQHEGMLSENVNIISNFLKFNGNIVTGFENHDRIIHVFNKNEHAIENDYFKVLKGRTNVILLGDSIGDASMANGVKDIDTVLRIGFLYEHAEDNLPAYKEAFDIVLINDQSMNVILDILNLLL